MSDIKIIKKLLPRVKEKILIEPIMTWGRQWAHEKDKKPSSKPLFHIRKSLLQDLDLIDHFLGQVDYSKQYDARLKKEVNAIWGSLGLILNFDGKVKQCGIDADNQELLDLVHNYVIPWFEERSIEYIEEYSGTEDKPRCHFRFYPQTDLVYLGLFLEQIKEDSGQEKWFPEQYPYGDRVNNLLRLEWGYHLKNQKINWGNLNGKDFEGIEQALEATISCKILDHDTLKSFIKPTKREKKTFVVDQNQSPLFTQEVNLGKPFKSFPDKGLLYTMGNGCQAFHNMCKKVDIDNLLDNNTGLGHTTGVYFSSVCQAHDQISKTEEGKELFQKVCEARRTRDWEEHNWDYYWNKQTARIPYCKTWEKTFNQCGGCPYKDQILSPRQLLYTKPLKKKKIKNIELKSFEWFRGTLFPELENKILRNLEFSERRLYGLKTPTGSGKSQYCDQLAVKLACQGKNVAIACNSFQVALEHKTNIEAKFGGEAFILGSFDSIMEYFNNNIICPNSSEIKEYRRLGVSTTVYKDKFCDNCPFLEKCNYPNQYKEVLNNKHKIVIIQHAHFSCPEVIRQIFKKHFDILFIDENFLDFLTTTLKPAKKELEVIEKLIEEIPWLKKLWNWMRCGGMPGTEIRPGREDLKPLIEAFNEAEVPYRLDQFIRKYNEKQYLDDEIGLLRFTPPPDINLIVNMDATLDKQELEIIFNRKDIEIIGDGIAVDPSLYHPESKTYQILDGRTSKTELLKKEKLYEYLEKVGDEMSDEYEDLTALIVVFKEHIEEDPKTGKKVKVDVEKECYDWLIRNYPEIIPRIAINHMAVGTNEFSKFNVIYLLAGPYMSNKEFKLAAFQLKFIQNYWLKLEGKVPLDNKFPSNPGQWGESQEEFVTRDHRHGCYEYKDYQVIIPSDFHEYLVYKRLRGRKVQALGRIRDLPGKKTIRKIFDKDYFPNVLIDSSFTEGEFLKEIRTPIED